MNKIELIRIAALAGLVLGPVVAMAQDYRQLAPVQVPVANATASNPAVDLRVWMDQPDLMYHPGEHASIFLRSSAAGYVTLINVNGQGVTHVIYPNTLHSDNRIRAGETLAIPGAPPAGATSWWAFAVEEPYGANVLKAVVTDQPWQVEARSAIDGIYRKLEIDPSALVKTLKPIAIPVAAGAPAQQGFFAMETVIFGVAPGGAAVAQTPVAPGAVPNPYPAPPPPAPAHVTPDVAMAPLPLDLGRNEFDLKAETDKISYRVGERMRVRVTPERRCRLALLDVAADGSYQVLLPTRVDEDLWAPAGRTTVYPQAGGDLDLTAMQPGPRRLLALCGAQRTWSQFFFGKENNRMATAKQPTLEEILDDMPAGDRAVAVFDFSVTQ